MALILFSGSYVVKVFPANSNYCKFPISSSIIFTLSFFMFHLSYSFNLLQVFSVVWHSVTLYLTNDL